ncbi:N-acetylneuraminate synthase family protein [Kiloniella sp.]|uniref:N-acetylneuraminate synthase family protein n=1 Tax=Kiloniella sp. TaxID=1938587 RepID=UPI003A9522DA
MKVIAEIGINHGGDIDVARKLINIAADAGVWGVKFQYRNLSNTYTTAKREIGDEILLNEIRRNYLSPDTILLLSNHAQTLNLASGISFFTPDDIGDFADQIQCFDFFKVPSVEFTNVPLIKELERYDKDCFISTGAWDEGVIETILPQLNPSIWTPLHCVSNYPVNLSNSKLGYLVYLQKKWDHSFGYSSHDEMWETCLLAMQLGATVIERHITLDKVASGLDHSSSSTGEEFSKLVAFSKNLKLIQSGDSPRSPNQGELLNLQNLGRSFYAKREIRCGEKIVPEDVVLRSPRTGLGMERSSEVFKKSAIRTVVKGGVLDSSVFDSPSKVSDETIQFAKDHLISLPVRFHDFELIESKYPIGRYEFHLSFGDLRNEINHKTFSGTNEYSIHLPDYISSTMLVDPFSTDEGQRQGSLDIINKTVELSKALQDHTGKDVLVVGSFSLVHQTLNIFYQQHAELLSSYLNQGVMILPQWLPPIAWYFGGAVPLRAMNNVEDIAHLKSFDMPICMDVCHLAMGDTLFDFQSQDVIKDLETNIRHIHIADAAGYDGEGVEFGAGDKKNQAVIDLAMGLDRIKVIEVWQGHLNKGAGFAKALCSLHEMYNGD